MQPKKAEVVPDPVFATAGQVAKLLGISIRTLYRLDVPGQIRLSRKLIRWRYADVVAWADNLRDTGAPMPLKLVKEE